MPDPVVVNDQIFEGTYRVSNDPVILTTIIGEAQIGGSAVFLDSVLLTHGQIEQLQLGSGALLRNRQLLVQTIVSDVNPQTNRTAVTTRLVGGPESAQVTQIVDAAQAGGIVAYRTIIDFV